MDNRRTRRKRVRRFIAYSLVILTAIICVLVAWGVYQFQHDPAYWTANEKFLKENTSEEIEGLANEAHNIISNALSTIMIQPNGQRIIASEKSPIEKTINLSTNQINAWLDRHFERWASNQNIQLPSEISNIMIHPENGRVAMAFRYSKGEIQKVISLVFDISMVGDGKAMFHLTQLRTGSLPLKPSWLSNNINDTKLKSLTNEMV
ncbi:MAG TPA: hypothetical protein DCM28_14250, partial [Phycisphaerales bacterium]|nr:hypothetical protein [Phycisphaerales bacterium]